MNRACWITAIGLWALAGCSIPSPVDAGRERTGPVGSLDPGGARWQAVGKELAGKILDNSAAWGKLPPSPAVAVLPLSSESQSTTQLGMVVAGGIEHALLDANRMRLLDRRAVDQILREQDFCMALSGNQVSRVGKAISADALLTGTLAVTGRSLVGEVRLTSVQTGELLARAVFGHSDSRNHGK